MKIIKNYKLKRFFNLFFAFIILMGSLIIPNNISEAATDGTDISENVTLSNISIEKRDERSQFGNLSFNFSIPNSVSINENDYFKIEVDNIATLGSTQELIINGKTVGKITSNALPAPHPTNSSAYSTNKRTVILTFKFNEEIVGMSNIEGSYKHAIDLARYFRKASLDEDSEEFTQTVTVKNGSHTKSLNTQRETSPLVINQTTSVHQKSDPNQDAHYMYSSVQIENNTGTDLKNSTYIMDFDERVSFNDINVGDELVFTSKCFLDNANNPEHGWTRYCYRSGDFDDVRIRIESITDTSLSFKILDSIKPYEMYGINFFGQLEGDYKMTQTIESQGVNSGRIRLIGSDGTKYQDSPSIGFLEKISAASVTGRANAVLQIEKSIKNAELVADGVGSYSVEGTEYGLYEDENAKRQIDTLTIGENGMSNKVKKLKRQPYYIKELTVGKGLKLDPEIYKVDLSKGNKEDAKAFQVSDEPLFDPFSFKISKDTEQEYLPLKDAEFTVNYTPFGQDTSTRTWVFKTNNEGVFFYDDDFKVSGDDLFINEDGETVGLYGTYEIVETKAPKGYQIDSTPYTVVLSEDGRKYSHGNHISNKPIENEGFKINNEPVIPGTFIGAKTDKETHAPLSGVEFTLFRIENNEEQLATKIDGSEITPVLTNDRGEFTFEQVPYGDYVARETKPRDGYIDEQVEHRFSILTNGQTVNADLLNTQQKGQITIKKIDLETNAPLENAEFEIRALKSYVKGSSIQEGDVLATIKTNKDGIAKTPKLELGKVDIVEIHAPTGYVLSDNKYTVEMLPDGLGGELTTSYRLEGESSLGTLENDLLTISNLPQKGNIEIRKQDVLTQNAQGDATLQGATYELTLKESYQKGNDSHNEVISTHVTNKNGIINIENLNIGLYKLNEINPSNGYVLNEEPIEFEITPDNTGNKLTENVIQTRFNYEKLLNEYNQHIKDLNILKRLNANGDEYEDIPLMPIAELEADKGVAITYEIPLMGRISVTKSLGNKENNKSTINTPEQGIVFEIYKGDKKVDEFMTKTDGRGTSKYLPYGEYRVHQVNTTKGYLLMDDFNIIIDKHYSEYQKNITNVLNQTMLRIVKKDAETGENIEQAGITFELLDSNKEKITMNLSYPLETEISQFTTSENGTVLLPEKLVDGTYYIKEISAPEGYYLDPDGEPVEFTLDSAVEVVDIFVKDIENIPQKGVLELIKKAPILTSVKNEKKLGFDIKIPVFEEKLLANTKWTLEAKDDIYSQDKKTLLVKKGENVSELLTNELKPVKTDEIPLGTYLLKEISTPDKYVKDPKTYEITFTKQDQHIRVHNITESKVNQRKAVEFEFKKEFEESNFEQKAIFGLFLKNNYSENNIEIKKDTLLDVIEVNSESKELSNGNIERIVTGKFENVPIDGEFYIQELATSGAYELDDNKYDVKFDTTTNNKVLNNVKIESIIKNKLIKKPIKYFNILDKNVWEFVIEQNLPANLRDVESLILSDDIDSRLEILSATTDIDGQEVETTIKGQNVQSIIYKKQMQNIDKNIDNNKSIQQIDNIVIPKATMKIKVRTISGLEDYNKISNIAKLIVTKTNIPNNDKPLVPVTIPSNKVEITPQKPEPIKKPIKVVRELGENKWKFIITQKLPENLRDMKELKLTDTLDKRLKILNAKTFLNGKELKTFINGQRVESTLYKDGNEKILGSAIMEIEVEFNDNTNYKEIKNTALLLVKEINAKEGGDFNKIKSNEVKVIPKHKKDKKEDFAYTGTLQTSAYALTGIILLTIVGATLYIEKSKKDKSSK